MSDRFKIYPDRLKNGNVELIEELFDPAFIGLADHELTFTKQVAVSGKVYLADENLILHLDVKATALMPCCICNEIVELPIAVNGLYHIEPLSDIKGAVYCMQELLREAVVIEVPKFAECNGGCSQRKVLAQYFKREGASPHDAADEEGYRPFAGIDL